MRLTTKINTNMDRMPQGTLMPLIKGTLDQAINLFESAANDRHAVADLLAEGQQQEARTLVLRMLRKRLDGLDEGTEARIEALSTERLEELGEALLDFSGPNDLAVWLQEHSE